MDLGLRLLAVAAVDDGDDSLRQVDEGEAGGRVAVEGGRSAVVAVVADALYERDLRQQGHVHLFCQLLATFFAKDIIFVLW